MKREILDAKDFFDTLAPYYDLIYDKKLKEKTKEEVAFIQNFLSKNLNFCIFRCKIRKKGGKVEKREKDSFKYN